MLDNKGGCKIFQQAHEDKEMKKTRDRKKKRKYSAFDLDNLRIAEEELNFPKFHPMKKKFTLITKNDLIFALFQFPQQVKSQ